MRSLRLALALVAFGAAPGTSLTPTRHARVPAANTAV